MAQDGCERDICYVHVHDPYNLDFSLSVITSDDATSLAKAFELG